MQRFGDLQPSLNLVKQGARSERAEFVGKFTDRLNQDRGGYKKLTYARIGKVLAHIPTQDLYAFWKKCDEAKIFGKVFWGALKVKCPKCGTGMWKGGECDFCTGKIYPKNYVMKRQKRIKKPWWEKA